MPFTQPQEVIDNFNQIKEKINTKFDDVFDLRPKADFIVKRTEAFREASAAADMSLELKMLLDQEFYVPIPEILKYNKFSDEALFLHEATPTSLSTFSSTRE